MSAVNTDPIISRAAGSSDGYLERHGCPCCDAPLERARPAVQSTPPAETLPLAEHGRFLSGYGSARVFFTYYRCAGCGGLYCPRYYTGEQLAALYRHQAENMVEVPLPARRKAQEGYAAFALRHAPPSGAFLELGADIGLLTEAVRQIRSFDHFWLYEPNHEVHAQLVSAAADQPHTVKVDDFRPSDVPAGSVSTAALVHVLDHLLDPVTTLREIRETLGPNGIVFTVTHNAASTLARVLGKRFPPYTLQHPQLFTPRSISAVFNRAGFDVVEIGGATNHFPVSHIANAGLSVLGMPKLVPAISRMTIPIQLGNMIAVARRRD
ncbi:class I SAM-dependent methyltransferase [Aurantimonas sp. MSK8Z-1]|uniref:class I SAM-dependent methyltransferase n=1 Tax=Mangrovibrevibacter kandeliae TaxID=2968473 RepID=UPI0021173056|nr:class I SAM-dependent methyltransferase [Aurantimonas sp. MSK8Z-1]MCW4116985.1 class I SAM-dependent methyltransferase [Aurantimonas sp. MSK8Z-1]